jgi:hypothetical protein
VRTPGIIEKSCIDGQKTYHTDLEKAMRAYITTHRNEFVEEGQADQAEDDEEQDEVSPTATGSSSHRDGDDSGSLAGSTSKDPGSRTWATPILECLEPILDLVSEQSPKTLAVGLVLFVLVLSNLWTLSSGKGNEASLHPSERGRSRSSAAGSVSRRSEVDTRTPDEVASAVRDVLQDYFKQQIKQEPERTLPLTKEITGGGWQDEAEEIGKVLDQLEERIRKLRGKLVVDELD